MNMCFGCSRCLVAETSNAVEKLYTMRMLLETRAERWGSAELRCPLSSALWPRQAINFVAQVVVVGIMGGSQLAAASFGSQGRPRF